MGEGSAEGGAVDGSPAGVGGVMAGGAGTDGWGLVGALAFGTEYFDGVDADFVA